MGLLNMLAGATSGGGGGVNVGTAIAYLELNTEKFNAGISTAVSKLDGAKSSLSSSLKNIGSSMTSVGSTLTKTVTLPIVGLGTAAVKSFADFEQGMAEVKAIAGQVSDAKEFQRIVNIGKQMGLSWDEGADMTETAMNIVKAKAEEMGATTEWTSTEAAEAFKYMAMAGWSVGDMLEGITPVMNLATASGEDLGTTSDIVTDALTAFGLEAKDTAHFTDILAKAASSSNTTVAKMGESFKYVAPVMGSLGMSAEDTAVALGLMANNGIKSGMAGRALKNILTNLAKGTGETAEAMETLDISLEKDNGEVKTLKELFDELRQKFRAGSGDVNKYTQEVSKLDAMYAEGKINEEEYADAIEQLAIQLYGVEGAEKAKLAAQLAGKQGMAGLLAIINANEEDYGKLTDAIMNCDGATDAMAATMRDTTYGSLKLMTSALDALARSFGELLAPVIREAAKYIKELAEKFNSLDDSTKETIIKFAGIAAVVGPLLVILGSLCSAISNIITLGSTLIGGLAKIPGLISGISGILGKIPVLLSNIGNLFTSTFGGIGMIIGGAITAIVNFVSMWQNGWDIIKTILEALGLAIAAIGAVILGAPALVAGVIAAIIFALSQLAIVIHDHWDEIKQWASETWEKIKEGWNNLVEWIKELWNGFVEWWQNLWNSIKEFFIEIWDSLTQKVSDAIDSIIEFVKNMWDRAKQWFDNVKQFISDFFENLKSKIKQTFDWIKQAVENFISNTKNSLQSFFENIKNKVSEMFENIKNKVAESFNNIRDKLQQFLENAKNKVLEFIDNILDKISSFRDKVVQILQELFDRARQKFEEMITLIRDKISEIVNTIREKLSEIVDTVREKISEIVDTVREWLDKLVETTKEKLKEIWQAIQDGLSEILSKIVEKCQEIWEKLKELASQLKEGAQQLFEFLVEKIKSYGSRFLEAGKELFTKLWEGIKEIWNQITAWVDEHFGWIIDKIADVVGRVRDAAGSIGDFFDGSHATGLSYVPFNGYVAQLHEGERVLTKQQNREYTQGRSGNGGDTYNIYSYEKLDEYGIRKELMKMKRQLDL